MTRTPTGSNVYYLPAPVAEKPAPRTTRRRRVGARLRSAWWRFRLALTEIQAILLVPRRIVIDDYAALLADEPEPAERPRPRRLAPARVIDFELARLRLRPGRRD